MSDSIFIIDWIIAGDIDDAFNMDLRNDRQSLHIELLLGAMTAV
jgi:hypothetical protein